MRFLYLAPCLVLMPPEVSTERAAPRAPPITALAFSSDGTKLIVGSQSGLEARSWPALERLRSFDTALPHVHDIAISPDNRHLVAAGGKPASAGGIEIYSWPDGRKLEHRTAYEDVVHGVAWSPDSRTLACATHDRTVGIHEVPAGTIVRRLRGHSRPVLSVAYLPDGATLVSAGADMSLRVWNAASGERQHILENHTAPVHDLSARPARANGAPPLLASVGADLTVRLWQPAIGRLVRFARLPATPLAVDWTADGEFVLAACDDGRLRVVDPDTVLIIAEYRVLEGWAHSLAVAPRGDEVAVGGDGGRLERVKLELKNAPRNSRKGTP